MSHHLDSFGYNAMSQKRAHISLKTKLAATLRELQHLRAQWNVAYGGTPEEDIPYNDAKLMSADQVVSLFHFDHNVLHAININDEHWNLTPRLIAEHREKSKRDTAIVAKSKRIRRKEATHAAHMSTDSFADLDRAMGSFARKRKIPSRPFPNKIRKLANKSRN